MTTTRRFQTDEDEYSVIRLQPSWALLSIAIFLFSLPLRFWARWAPWHPRHYYLEPDLLVTTTVGVSVAGMLVAWLGLYSGGQRQLARWGLLLNGTVAVLMILLASAALIYFRLLR
ncbi:MAG: hypothetical protein AAF725_02385 [Acidobacteriota bacterium]